MEALNHTQSDATTVKVWDPLVRIFHWSLVLFFAIAYLTEDDFETIHSYAGYTVAALVGFRLVWGLIGTRHARFSDFVKSPATTIDYIKRMQSGSAPRYRGHNPAGGAMVMALLFSLLMTTLCGISLLAIDGEGPLAGTFFASLPEDPIEALHELFANGTLLLIFLHVAGVIYSSYEHKENLVRSMIHGRKQALPDDK